MTDQSQRVTLAEYEGTPVVANFFASWCTACEAELPGFSKVSDELRGQVQFLGINSQETGNGLAMAQDFGIDWWPIGVDQGGGNNSGLHRALGGRGMPLTAFYSADGELLNVANGALVENQLRAELRRLYGVDV
ncbi:MAG: TlpA family protein disulfide reductase [Euzebya sp.]